jgi:hypothetical protein
MNIKAALNLFTILLLIGLTSNSQSVYYFQYNFHQSDDSIAYHAFFTRYEDGSGLLRIRFIEPPKGQDVVAEMDIDEQPVLDNNGVLDSTHTLFNSINPRIIIGDSNEKINLPSFLFTYNPANDFLEPSAVFSSVEKEKRVMNSKTTFVAELISNEGLNKNFVQQFFSEDEDFFVNLFTNKTKGLTPVEKGVRLHLLVVADTLDKEIGSACAKDMRRTVETFTGLTDFLGIKIFIKTICGKEYSKQNIQTAVNNLKPSVNDIVIFYYTGHGFRIPEKPARFPNLKLKNFRNLRENFRDSITWINKDRRDNITYSMNIEDIFNSIKKKRARFNLVMSDCCNNDIFSTNAVGTKPGKTKGSGIEWSEDNIRTLFLNKTPMSILLTAASSGEKATSNNDFGGFCSYFFKTSMENYCSKLKTNVTWDLVLQDTQKQTIFKARHTYCDKPYIPANICQQNPDYKIVLGTTN